MPTSPTVTIGSEAFNEVVTAQSVLCIEVGSDRFRFVVQSQQQRIVRLEDYTFSVLLSQQPLVAQLPDVFEQHEWLTASPWQHIRIGINSTSFTLVPETLYRQEYAASYLALMRGGDLPPYESAQAYHHSGEHYWSVFGMSHALADFFARTFPIQTLTFLHQTSALLEATAVMSRQMLTPDQVFLYFEDEWVSVIVRKSGALQFCNRFRFRNPADMVYYVLYVLDEQQLQPADVSVRLYGEITPFSETYTELNRFLPALNFGEVPAALQLSSAFSDTPEHRYLSLFGLCLAHE